MKCKKLNIINVLMKSLIHIIMDITKYRQHVVNSPYVTNHLNGEPWEEVRVFVPHICVFATGFPLLVKFALTTIHW